MKKTGPSSTTLSVVGGVVTETAQRAAEAKAALKQARIGYKSAKTALKEARKAARKTAKLARKARKRLRRLELKALKAAIRDQSKVKTAPPNTPNS